MHASSETFEFLIDNMRLPVKRKWKEHKDINFGQGVGELHDDFLNYEFSSKEGEYRISYKDKDFGIALIENVNMSLQSRSDGKVWNILINGGTGKTFTLEEIADLLDNLDEKLGIKQVDEAKRNRTTGECFVDLTCDEFDISIRIRNNKDFGMNIIKR